MIFTHFRGVSKQKERAKCSFTSKYALDTAESHIAGYASLKRAPDRSSF
jgi:hypothetical protein